MPKHRTMAERLKTAEEAAAQSDQDKKNMQLILAAIVQRYHKGTVILDDDAVLKYIGKKVQINVASKPHPKPGAKGHIIVSVDAQDVTPQSAILTPGDPRFEQTAQQIVAGKVKPN